MPPWLLGPRRRQRRRHSESYHQPAWLLRVCVRRGHWRVAPRDEHHALRVLRFCRANAIVSRTAAILLAAQQAGAEFIVENPPDRSNRDTPYFLHSRHCPIRRVPDFVTLRQVTGSDLITFPQCAFGADYQKYTSLLVSPGLLPALRPLASLACKHTQHRATAGGGRVDGNFTSPRSAAYPPDLNYLLARILASHRPGDTQRPAVDAVAAACARQALGKIDAGQVLATTEAINAAADLPEPAPEGVAA